ncbi:MAG: tetratricopeptide repeat protein [Planctomycetes bacterium]|nr:tetratricopeptide repeat protein [Planctomycetota bacterium]
MFGWFTPKCPVDTDAKLWIEYRMAWLIKSFGWEPLRKTEGVLPTEEHFPDPFDRSGDSIRRLLDRVAGYMDVDPSRIDLQFYDEGPFDRRTAGLYDERDGKTTIWLEAANTEDAITTVATLAHELGHVRLLGERRVTEDAADHEPLTDLLTVFFGLGVFPANSVVTDNAYHSGNWEYWSISRQGYLSAPMFGYALALRAWLREETATRWAGWLRPDARVSFRRGRRYLNRSDQPRWLRDDDLPLEPAPCPDWLLARLKAIADDASVDQKMTAGTASEYATRATIHLQHGNLDHAIADLAEAIRLDPRDVECYQERACALAEMGRYEEAIADADEAIRIDPENIGSYGVRGMIRQQCGHFQRAIADLDRCIENTGGLNVDPQWAGMYWYRGLARAGLLQWRQAVVDYTRALRRAPSADLYRDRATAYTELGKAKKAQADRHKAAQLDPDSLEAPEDEG